MIAPLKILSSRPLYAIRCVPTDVAPELSPGMVSLVLDTRQAHSALRTPYGDARLEKVSIKPEIYRLISEDLLDRRRTPQCSPESSA